jgi:hypothetical protein
MATQRARKRAPSRERGVVPKSKEARWVDIHEGELDEAQVQAWLLQASRLPGWTP